MGEKHKTKKKMGVDAGISDPRDARMKAAKNKKNKFIYFQIKFESIREVYKKQHQPIFFFNISCCKNVKGEK